MRDGDYAVGHARHGPVRSLTKPGQAGPVELGGKTVRGFMLGVIALARPAQNGTGIRAVPLPGSHSLWFAHPRGCRSAIGRSR